MGNNLNKPFGAYLNHQPSGTTPPALTFNHNMTKEKLGKGKAPKAGKGVGAKPQNPERGKLKRATFWFYPDQLEYLKSLQGKDSEALRIILDEHKANQSQSKINQQ